MSVGGFGLLRSCRRLGLAVPLGLKVSGAPEEPSES